MHARVVCVCVCSWMNEKYYVITLEVTQGYKEYKKIKSNSYTSRTASYLLLKYAYLIVKMC